MTENDSQNTLTLKSESQIIKTTFTHKGDMRRFIEILKEEEENLLAEKTSFGRNDLKLLLEKAKVNALIRYMDEKLN